MKRSWKRESLLAGLLIVLLATVGYGTLLRAGEIPYSAHSDIIAQHLGTKTVLFRSLQEGHGVPFWRDDMFAGYPALTNPQALYTYPLHFLFYFLPPEDALGWTIWLHLVAMAAAFYVVGHVLGLGMPGKLFMAVSALFSFKLVMAVYAGWLPHLAGIALFPFLFAALFYAVAHPGHKAALTLSAAGALCLHTGHLQYGYYSALFLSAYVLARAVVWVRDREWRMLQRAASCLSIATLLSLGLAAYLLVPLISDVPLMSRQQASYSFFLANHSLRIPHLLTLFYPEAFGTPLDGSYVEMWEDVAYFGVLQLSLAIAGLVWGWRREYTRYLAIAFCFSVILTFDAPVLRVAYWLVPGFGLFRCPSRFLFLTSFFGIALGGIGVQEMLARLQRRSVRPWVAPVAVGLVLLVISAEGLYYARRYVRTVPKTEVLTRPDYESQIRQDKDVFRVAPLRRSTLTYGFAALLGVQLVTGYDSFNFAHYRSYLELVRGGHLGQKKAFVWADLTGIARNDLLDIANVKYVVSGAPLRGFGDRFEEVRDWANQPVFILYEGMTRQHVYLYRNKTWLPRAFWIRKVIQTADESEMSAQMELQNLRDEAVILNGLRGSVMSDVGSGDHVNVRESFGGFLRVGTESARNRFLVMSEVWHPGWQLYVDGKRTAFYRTDLALMGAWIPGGKHEVTLSFRPLHWSVSVAMSAASCGIFLLLLCFQVVRRS